jgi:hypothetical protein
MNNLTYKSVAAILAGVAGNVVDRFVPLAVVTTGLVMADCVSAWMLARRVAREGRGDGRFSSRKAGRVFATLAKVYGVLILSVGVDMAIVRSDNISVARFVAGAVCLWQALSIVENEASVNNSRWARVARRYLVDKAARHGINID